MLSPKHSHEGDCDPKEIPDIDSISRTIKYPAKRLKYYVPRISETNCNEKSGF